MPETNTHRRVIGTGTLTAVAVGQLGTSTAEASTPPAPTTVASVINFPELTAETERLLAQHREESAEYRRLADQLYDVLTEEQQALLRDVIDDFGNHETTYNELMNAEMARHAPGPAPVLRLLWEHAIDTRIDELGRRGPPPYGRGGRSCWPSGWPLRSPQPRPHGTACAPWRRGWWPRRRSSPWPCWGCGHGDPVGRARHRRRDRAAARRGPGHLVWLHVLASR
jgi:hypothetical protein